MKWLGSSLITTLLISLSQQFWRKHGKLGLQSSATDGGGRKLNTNCIFHEAKSSSWMKDQLDYFQPSSNQSDQTSWISWYVSMYLLVANLPNLRKSWPQQVGGVRANVTMTVAGAVERSILYPDHGYYQLRLELSQHQISTMQSSRC